MDIRQKTKTKKCNETRNTEDVGLKYRPAIISAAGIGALIGQLTVNHLQGELVNRKSMTCGLAQIQYEMDCFIGRLSTFPLSNFGSTPYHNKPHGCKNNWKGKQYSL